LAIVGRSGSGESTLVDLLLGIRQPDHGQIAISGEDPTLTIDRHPGCIAYVPQHVGLLNSSIRDNVLMGLSEAEADDAQVWESLRLAHLDKAVREHPDGLDSLIGEGGVRLRGGQRQRLGLARALVTSPRLIFLDEDTSALDTETEAPISETIQGLNDGVTKIVVAHRLATVMAADTVIYMSDGRIEALALLRKFE
jgi:ABC-type multidrug transport system fused ATPase/permease subunit